VTPSNYIPGVRRRQITPLYDTVTVATTTAFGASKILFGSVAGTAGIQNTNMTKAYELPGTEKFILQAMRIVAVNVAGADLISLATNYCVRFIRGRAVELEAPLEYFAGGAGVSTPLAASTVANNGAPDPRAVASLGDDPIIIEGGDHFEVNFVGTTFTTTATCILRVYLDGWFDKGVQ
jgi:hypothetical protein